MEQRKYDETAVLNIIERIINEASLEPATLERGLYHHNSSFENAPSIIRNGILPIIEINKMHILKYDEDSLTRILDIESHPNGIDGISLSLLGLDDLYANEFEYDPRSMRCVDFTIDGSIKTSRNSTNYGNEFISYKKIDPSLIKSIDIRLIKLVEHCKKTNNEKDIEFLVNCYNALCAIADQLIISRSDIILREMSNEEEIKIDIERISRQRLLNEKIIL